MIVENTKRCGVSLFTVTYFSMRSKISIGECDWPPSWSPDGSETGEITKFPLVRVVGLTARRALHHPYPRAFCALPTFARIKRPRWQLVELNDGRVIYDLKEK